MPITLQHGAGITARGMAGSENPTWVAASDPEVTTPGSSTPVTVDDAEFSRDTAADTRSRYRCEGSFQGAAAAPTYASSDEGVATVGEHGATSYIGAGTATITATTNRGTVGEDLAFGLQTGATVDTLTGWIAGSLAEECADNIDTLISGVTASVAKPVFSTQSPGTPNYVRNTSCWAADWVEQMTCISPWNSTGAHKRAGTLVTARHMIGAAHYKISNGATVRFVASDNTVHDRTVSAQATHPSYSPHYPDLTIYTLSSDLPAAITPCKVAPATLADHFGNLSQGIPTLILDQEEKALVADLYNIGTQASHKTPTAADRLALHEELISGDSGNPFFLLVGSDLVLTTVATNGGAGSGTFIGDHIAAINTMIGTADTAAGVSTGYTVTAADLSAYPTY